jgi:hypothetical protein
MKKDVETKTELETLSLDELEKVAGGHTRRGRGPGRTAN